MAAAGKAVRHGSEPKDFCNSFWGPGDDGVNILFSRMRGAVKTTEELKYFWNERAAIEEQYASRLANLAKFALGGEEIGELRQALDTLKTETESQAAAHANLADRIRTVIEQQATALHNNQHNHKKNSQTPVEKLFKQKQSQESFVNKAREKYDGDLLRINSYTQQVQYHTGKDLDRLQQKLKRAQQTVQANEKDYNNFTQALLDMLPGWEKQWKEFCDSCQDLEEERLELMKDNLWAYANEVSTVCVSDDQSCEQIRTVLDQMEPERDLQNFVVDYGTGNTISDPQTVAPYDQSHTLPTSSTMITRPADFKRVSRRTMSHGMPGAGGIEGYQPPREPVPPLPQTNGHSEPHRQDSGGSIPGQSHNHTSPPSQHQISPSSVSRAHEEDNASLRSQQPPTGPPPSVAPPPPPPPVVETYPPQSTVSTPSRKPVRESQPLPMPAASQWSNEQAPPVPALPIQQAPAEQESLGGILFYVKALYDYTATIEEEFDFQAGDVIAVTATPDDGWWSGELLDEARREPGRHIFPSNFVCLF